MGLSRLRHACALVVRRLGLLAIVLPWFLNCSALAAEDPAEKVYLSVNISVRGEGSYPVKGGGVSNSSQKWTLRRDFAGYLEADVVPTVIGVPPNQRSVLAVQPMPGGLSTVVGTLRDRADQAYENSADGGSSMVYGGGEEWHNHAVMDGRDLIAELFLDKTNRTWNGTIGLATWQRVIEADPKYTGSSSYTPGQAGGWQEPGNHYATDPQDWRHPLSPISGGYLPRYTLPAAIPIENLPVMLSEADTYDLYTTIPMERPPDALGDQWKMELTLDIKLIAKPPPAELVVRSSRYEYWMNALQPDLSPSEPLHFVAQVESPTGGSLERVRVKKYTWTLNDTSREPGVALNYPMDANDTKPDMTLVGWTTDAEGQKSEHTPPDGDLFSSIEVHTHDWGAWSTLRVEAELEDGRVLHGRLDPPPPDAPDTDILLPRRHKDSKVSLLWRTLMHVTDQADKDDKDARPPGKPGADGDGFSVYEEYRGVYVKGEYLFLDPEMKDLFVLNDSGDRVARALGRFTALSQLTVHELKAPTAIWPVNKNRREGPTAGDQNALWIRDTGLGRRPNRDLPAGTRPRDRKHIRVPTSDNRFRKELSQQKIIESTVLQALFQSVAVERPGPDDHFRRFEVDHNAANSTNEPSMTIQPEGTRVVVIDFFGNDVAKQWLSAGKPGNTLTWRTWLVGEKGGAHSGPEECVMRDWFADVYRTRFTDPQGRPVYRLIDPSRGPEQPGTILGNTRRGTGVNAPDRQPEPRYGDSNVGTPANRQMIIADHLP